MTKEKGNKPQSTRAKSHRKRKPSVYAVARPLKLVPEGHVPDVPAVALPRDITAIPALADALEFFNDEKLDKVLAKDFLTKCMATMKANDIQMKITLPRDLSTPGKCYISHPPENEVTIWDNNQIVDHMSLKDAENAGILPCSAPRR